MRNKTNTFVFALSAALMFYATGVNSQEANEVDGYTGTVGNCRNPDDGTFHGNS